MWILDKLPIETFAGYQVMLQHILDRERSAKVLIAAFQRMLQHPCSMDLQPLVTTLLKHQDETVRMYAVRCSDGLDSFEMMLEQEPSAKVVSEIILKCSGNPKNIGLISRFFSHPHWKVRAASVAAMVDTAPDSVNEIKKNYPVAVIMPESVL